MARKLNTRGQATAQAIANAEDFTTHGSLSGETIENRWQVSPGRLSGDDREQFHADRDSIVYVVWSYATPIAWKRSDGTWHKVAQKFSVTTSKHQGNLYLI